MYAAALDDRVSRSSDPLQTCLASSTFEGAMIAMATEIVMCTIPYIDSQAKP